MANKIYTKLPTEYIIECSNKEQTTIAANAIKGSAKDLCFWKYVYVSPYFNYILYNSIGIDTVHLLVIPFTQWHMLYFKKEEMKIQDKINELNEIIDLACKERFMLIEQLKKEQEPEFKVGEWLYCENVYYEYIFRFNGFNLNFYKTNEYYRLDKLNISITQGYSDSFLSKNSKSTRATKEQIERILNKVAESKGLVKGAKYKNPDGSLERIITSSLFLSECGNNYLIDSSNYIIYNGSMSSTPKWATLIEEPKKEEIIAKSKIKELEELTNPIRKWLCENYDPYAEVHITGTTAKLLEGKMSIGENLDYIKN